MTGLADAGGRERPARGVPLPPEALELLRPDRALGVPIPGYLGRSLPNLASSIARTQGHDALGPLPPLDAALDPFGGRRAEGTVVVLLVDGLGLGALLAAARTEGAPVARSWAARARPITSVFPSSTTTALTSLSTAAAPSQHGVVGHRLYLPRFGSVVELLRMAPLGGPADNSLVGPEWSPSLVSGVPTVFQRGVRATAVSRDRFEGTGFTRMIYDGARYASYATFAGLGHELRALLAGESPPPLLFVYWDELDMALHRYGRGAGLTAFEVERLGGLLAWVARGLSPSARQATRVVVTADHGLVSSAPSAQLEVDRLPSLADKLARPPSGDRRAAFFQPRAGALAALRTELEERIHGAGRVLSTSQAIDAGLLGPGPFHPELAERVGELVVLPDAPGGVLYRLPGTPTKFASVGAHGGLDPEELLVPLVAGSLDELGAGAAASGRAARPPEKR